MKRPDDRPRHVSEPVWLDRPPDYSPLSPILKIEPGRTREVCILSSALTGVWTHWHLGRTLPCTGEHGVCWCDHFQTSRRWQGWLAVQVQYGYSSYWMALGAAAARDCPCLYDTDKSIRGVVISVTRPGGNKNGKVALRPLGKRLPEDKMFTEPNARQFLLKLWGQWCPADRYPPAEGGEE